MDFENEREALGVVFYGVELPKKYKVIMHNDDYTAMEFVVEVLTTIFRKSENEAVRLMQKIHIEGFAVCGVYTQEIAETKVEQTIELARENGYPLRCTMEEE